MIRRHHRPWISAALGAALAALAGGCDSDASPSACLPEQGCDGIAEIVEVEAPPNIAAEQPSESDAAMCPATHIDEASYVAEDPEVCAELVVECHDGWVNLDPGCGCGCVFADYEPETAGAKGAPWPVPLPPCGVAGPSERSALSFRDC